MTMEMSSIGTMPDGTSRAVICNHPGQPSSYHPLHPNEDAAIVTVPEGSVHAPEDWHQAVHDHTGSAPEAIRCAMIDNTTGEVIAEVIADPDIDVAPDGCRLEIR
jgi:hypothetical protein